ncbi:MAG: hypothetical protein NTX50_15775 [Candidatus Sumerlaeota bacterium]|nr:hypothetical protein [Candidatus Sumerlaeota bacterium]
MKTNRIHFAVLLLAVALISSARAAETAKPSIAFPAALDAAAVVQSSIGNINSEALMLGNGDLMGLLWERNGMLCLRVAKNDIWDARVDTSQDVPLMRVDVANNKWSGGAYPPSWKKKNPQPRCAAVIKIGAGGAGGAETGAWQRIRSGGEVNEWLRQGDTGVMAISGKAGASAGYRWSIAPAPAGAFTAFKLRLSGSAGAQYFVNVLAVEGKHPVASGWKDSPATEQEVSFPISAASPVSAVEVYVQTKDGARAENRIRRIALEGGKEPLVIPPGMPDSGITSARLDLRSAVAEIKQSGGAPTIVCALANCTAFLIETEKEVSLEEIKSAELPAAEQGETSGVKWLYMKMPGDVDYAGMEYTLAVAANGTRKVVSVATSFDTKGNVRDAAIRLARETAAEETTQLLARHEQEWARYWAASGVELDDPDFQLWWYRMVYYLRCFSKPGATPVGLFAGLAGDNTPWHGDYHQNYNIWQPYWTPFIINHPDQAEPWIRYMKEMLPRLRWLAKTTYDCEGACIGISTFAFEPDPAKCKSVNCRQVMIPPYGYTLGMAGMAAQNLWYSHLYRPDRKYLDETIYPVIREVALFYCSFAEKCPRDAQGKAVFGPSYSPEHGKFGVANVPFDIAYARFMLKAAIAASGELGRDADLAARFREALDLLPPYPTAPDESGKPVVVDWTGCKFREIKTHNIIVPDVPVFPADQVTWVSPEPEKELFRNTIRQTHHRGSNSTVMFGVVKARFSMLDALEDARKYYKTEVQPNGMFHWPMHGFYLSESVGLAAMISEFLMQSVDNVIRIFPCWPKEKDAKFDSLRAQGGFLVSAAQAGGRVKSVTIRSTAGGKLKFVNPWPAAPQARKNGATVTLAVEGAGLFSLDTVAGDTVVLEPIL